ncbi:MAG: ADP-ribosylglycohydrolase family protein [Oscillospiraceae bacterium]|nr:ADP-ribosylglycohydrolase family protein [Oscillospiraceae bacterium]
MAANISAYRGCLLGLAVGDAMGYTIDGKRWSEIQNNYGPNGLLGYDLVNGYADVTSYTQLAAYITNGLLTGTTRGQMQGKMLPYIHYATKAIQEWGLAQHTRRTPDRPACWVSRVPQLRRRRCMDTRMLDTLSRGRLGTPEEPVNCFCTPGSITAAIPAGLFFTPERMRVPEIGRLGAEAVALTHGEPLAFLSGAVLAYTIAGILQDHDTALAEHFLQAADAVAGQFGRQYPQAAELQSLVHRTVASAAHPQVEPREAMEHMNCDDTHLVLAGAMYAALVSCEDFDAAMIIAVNHSGRSSAVGAVTGAILGAWLGEEALPDFYMECLETADVLRTLADDVVQGCPMERGSKLFDDDWDQKYIQGRPVDRTGWAIEE